MILASVSVRQICSNVSLQAPTIEKIIMRYCKTQFLEATIDTGFAKESTWCKNYHTYCRHVALTKIFSKSYNSIPLWKSNATAVAAATVTFQPSLFVSNFRTHELNFDVLHFHLISWHEQTRDLFHNVGKSPLRSGGMLKIHMFWFYGHEFIAWDTAVNCFQADRKLSILHRRSASSHKDKTFDALKRAELETTLWYSKLYVRNFKSANILTFIF